MDYAWPTSKAFCPSFYELGMRANVQLEVSTYNGGLQSSEIPGSRWVARMQLPSRVNNVNVQPVIEAYFAKVRGQANRIVMGHLKKRVLGNLSGTVNTSAAQQGDQTIELYGSGVPAEGDMLTITTASGAQWVMVTGVTPESGGSVISFSAPLRANVTGGSTILYQNTTTRWVLMASEVMVGYGAHANPGVSVDLMEVWN
jgi:hypothetical protein